MQYAIKHIIVSVKTDDAQSDASGPNAIETILQAGATAKGYSFEELNVIHHDSIDAAFKLEKQ